MGLAHFIFQLGNLTNQILLVGMQLVGFQVPVVEVYCVIVNRLVLCTCNYTTCKFINFFGFQDVDCIIEKLTVLDPSLLRASLCAHRNYTRPRERRV